LERIDRKSKLRRNVAKMPEETRYELKQKERINAPLDPVRRKMLLSGTAAMAMMGLSASASAVSPTPADASTSYQNNQGGRRMNTITTKDGTSIYFKDWGAGQPVVFSHGWRLNADAWDAQMLFLGQHGYRVIAHAIGAGTADPASRGTEMT
jgi:non-heme chloroperoxidase